MEKIAALSGGSAKGPVLAGGISKTRNDYSIYTATSVGSLAAALLSVEKHDELEYEMKNTTNREIYGLVPPIKNGELNFTRILGAGLVATARGRNYLYKFGDVLEKKLRRHFSHEDFYKLKRSGRRVYVTNYNYQNPKAETDYVCSSDPKMTHDQFVRAVVASASIPIFAKPQLRGGKQNGDGGVKDPSPTTILSQFPNAKVDVWLTHSIQDEEDVMLDISSIGKVALSVLKASRHHTRFNDLKQIRNPNTTIIYAPHLDWDSANFDTKLMSAAYDHGAALSSKGMLDKMSINEWRKINYLSPLK